MESLTPIAWFQADKKRAAVVLNEFEGMNMYDMKKNALNTKLNVDIYDYNEKYNRYDVIDTWIDESNK